MLPYQRNQKNAILVLFAHPALQKSRVHSKLLNALKNLEGVTLRDLYQEYPDFNIDVKAEQALLETHSVVVFQHPLYWYSTPAILKEWQDLVLEHGWAYGKKGKELSGKLFFSVISTGGPEKAYLPGGFSKYPLRHLLGPIEQTVRLCRMFFLPPFLVHATHALESDAINQAAVEYREILTAAREGRINPRISPDHLRLTLELVKQEE